MEQVSAQLTHRLIDDTTEFLLAFPIGDMLTHFTGSGSPSSMARKPTLFPHIMKHATNGASTVELPSPMASKAHTLPTAEELGCYSYYGLPYP
jgi:hypothetical protein